MDDLSRIAEIEIFNYRLNFYPIFRDDGFYFRELQVLPLAESYHAQLDRIRVYDDGVVKGFILTEGQQVRKLFVEPVLQGNRIGSELLLDAIREFDVRFLWALEKNDKAIRFYARHGFVPTGERMPEEDTTEYLVRLERGVTNDSCS